jgi:hypothetical protein
MRLSVFVNHAFEQARLYLDLFALSSSHEHQTGDMTLVCELYDTLTADNAMLLTTHRVLCGVSLMCLAHSTFRETVAESVAGCRA